MTGGRGTEAPPTLRSPRLAKSGLRPKGGAMDEMAKIERAVAAGKLLPSSAANMRRTLESATSPIAVLSIAELVEGGEWTELNDRFYRALAFGTGGIRGRTIGKIVTRAERGTPQRTRPAGVSLRRHERDELLQRRPRDAGAGRISARVVRAAKTERPAEARDRARHALFLGGFYANSRPKVAAENGCDACRLRRSALDAGTFLRRAACARERRHRDHRQPQPAARQRLQSLLRRRRASGRAARQRRSSPR